MASDYEYEGIVNNQHSFRERSSGTWATLPSAFAEQRVELLDGDEFSITEGSVRQIWSIREHRVVRSDFV